MTMPPDERRAWLRLLQTPGLGNAGARALLARFGLPQTLFSPASTFESLCACVGADTARAVRAPLSEAAQARIAASETWLDGTPDAFLLTVADPDFPSGLLDLADPPLVVFGRGRRDLLARPAIAVVGSRSATRQGESNARAFARHLAQAGRVIISGLAHGIDANAHQGALDHDGGTIAVMGTGIDIIYPQANSELAAAIAARGLLISEFAPGTPALPAHFPKRNRIIAALSDGVLVVEAALRSGSLITARLAGELGRDVFAVPGSIHTPQARGCHRLIREGAKLVESGMDILEELQGGRKPSARMPDAEGSSATSGAGDKQLLELIGFEPVGADVLAHASGLGAAGLGAALMELELNGLVEVLPGNRYQRIRSQA